MDKRKFTLIIIGVIGVLVLIIGIGAARVYTQTYSMVDRNVWASVYYDRYYSELNGDEKAVIDAELDGLGLRLSISEKNDEFRQWLVKLGKWVGIPVGAFIILTGSMVASRLILDRIRRR